MFTTFFSLTLPVYYIVTLMTSILSENKRLFRIWLSKSFLNERSSTKHVQNPGWPCNFNRTRRIRLHSLTMSECLFWPAVQFFLRHENVWIFRHNHVRGYRAQFQKFGPDEDSYSKKRKR